MVRPQHTEIKLELQMTEQLVEQIKNIEKNVSDTLWKGNKIEIGSNNTMAY